MNLKGYIKAMNYDKETIHQCIRNIFIILQLQMPQSWSSLESHFQSEQECLWGQVHGVSLAVAGCPSFHIAVFNHAVPSCRNLKLHGHKCRRATLSVCSKLCALWQILVQNQRNPLERYLWPSLESGIEHMQLCGQKWWQSPRYVNEKTLTYTLLIWFNRSEVTVLSVTCVMGFVFLNQQGPDFL